MIGRVEVRTRGKGLNEITQQVQGVVGENGLVEGLCTVMVQHTSASLTIQENADPSAARDLEDWLDRHVPEHDPSFTHTLEDLMTCPRTSRRRSRRRPFRFP